MEALYEEYAESMKGTSRVTPIDVSLRGRAEWNSDVCIQRKLPRYIVTYKVEPGDKQALFNALDLVMEMSNILGIEDFHYYKENWYVEIVTRNGDAFKLLDVYEAPEFDESKFDEEKAVETLRKIEALFAERNKHETESSDDA